MTYGLPLVALLLFASALGIPTGIPIWIALTLAGAYLIGSIPVLAAAIVALAATELAGTLLLHGIARTGGVGLLDRVASHRQERVQATFDRWQRRLGGRDVAAIAVLRLIPLVRMGVTVGSGLMRLRLRDFVLGAAIASLMWTGLPLSAGYLFRANLETVEATYGQLAGTAPLILGVVTLIVLVTVLGRNPAIRNRLRGRAASRPEIGQETPPGLR